MRGRSPWLAVPIAGAIVLVGALAWWAVRPRPTLDGVAFLVDSGRFQAAEGRLREYLRAYPGHEFARILLAKVAVDRPEPDPQLALDLLEGLRPADPHRAAMVRGIEGDAHFWARRYDKAEPAWLEALRLEPTIAEVGWKLLNIYEIQAREDDSRRLALRLFPIETDPRDRVQLLLQLIRHNAHPIEAGSVVHQLEPVVKANPEDWHSALSLGSALIGCGRQEDGLNFLRREARSRGDELDAWCAYLDGLIETGRLDELARVLDEVPRPLATSPRIEVARGWLAAQGRDLPEATRAYRRAFDARPADPALAYRYKSVLRQGRRDAELAESSTRLDAIAKFPDAVRALFDRINELPDLGLSTHPDLFKEVAALLGRVGRKEEADAWMVLAGAGKNANM